MIDINASVSQLFLCNIRAQANQTFTGARNVRRPTLEASVVYQNVQDYDCFIFDSLSINYISIYVQVKHIAMPQRSRWSVSVPEVDIPTYLFGDPTTPLGDAHAFADAEDPETLSMTWTELRLWSQRLAAGLQAAGLEESDRCNQSWRYHGQRHIPVREPTLKCARAGLSVQAHHATLYSGKPRNSGLRSGGRRNGRYWAGAGLRV